MKKHSMIPGRDIDAHLYEGAYNLSNIYLKTEQYNPVKLNQCKIARMYSTYHVL